MLLGRYEILETIGRGATSSVWKARDTLIGRIVALKTLQPGLSDPHWRERFLAEARIVGQLSHPSIVSLYDVGIDETSGAPYLVMEYIVGETLERLLSAGKTDPRQACAWGAELARALAYAHGHGVIHGDIKPANILVSEDRRVKLMDFGVARWATQISQTGNLGGTPAFLAPEQIEGRATDSRSDLFSLGIVLYQMATGQRPFQGDSVTAVCAQILKARVTPPTEVNPALPAALDDVIECCLAKDPADRYTSGEELAAALEGVARQAASRKGRAKPRATVLGRYAWVAGLFLIAFSAPAAIGFFGNSLRLPPPPAAVFPVPKPPAELRLPAETTISAEEAPRLEIAWAPQDPPPAAQPKADVAARNSRSAPRAASASAAKNAQAPPAPKPATATETPPVAPPPKPAPEPANSTETSRSAAVTQLTVEISARASDETLAVFADRELLFKATLASVIGKEGEPFRTSYTLPTGPHHLSVALYKADNTLRAEKEGLADLRKGARNVLAIQVTKRSKFMPLRGPGLKITWPGEAASSEPAQSPSDPPAKTTASKF